MIDVGVRIYDTLHVVSAPDDGTVDDVVLEACRRSQLDPAKVVAKVLGEALCRADRLSSLDLGSGEVEIAPCVQLLALEELVRIGVLTEVEDPDYTHMMRHCVHHYNDVELVARAGAPPNRLLQIADGETLLHKYAARGNVAGCSAMLAAPWRERVAVDARSRVQSTPFLLAVEQCHPEVAAVLLEQGAEVGVVDRGGLTALHLAASHAPYPVTDRWRALMQILLNLGSDLNARGGVTGATPLVHMVAHSCARVPCVEGVALLLQAGADPSIPDASGRTALYHATRETSLNACRLLLEGGAEPTLGHNVHASEVVGTGYGSRATQPEVKALLRLLREWGVK